MKRIAVAIAALLWLPAASGADDPDPPELRAAWLDQDTYDAGGIVRVTMEWYDASGLDVVWAVAMGPNQLNAGGPNCYPDSDAEVVEVTCELTLPERAPAGEWRINQMSAMDKVGHQATGDIPLTFTVASPYTDVLPPELTSLEAHVDRFTVKQDQQQFFSISDAFTLTASDETGVRSGGIGFIGPGGNLGMSAQCEQVIAEGQLSCTVYGGAHIPNGRYYVDQLTIGDTAGYDQTYSDNDKMFRAKSLSKAIGQAPWIDLSTDGTDASPPELVGVTFPDQAYRGERFAVYINISEEENFELGILHFRTTRGNAGISGVVTHMPGWESRIDECVGTWKGDIRLKCIMSFPANFPLGLSLLENVHLSDKARNQQSYSSHPSVDGQRQHFQDDDTFDTGITLLPRPINGVVNTLDAVVNEVVPEAVVEIVYEASEVVEDIIIQVVDSEGLVADLPCTLVAGKGLETVCTVTAPSTEGVYALASVTATIDGQSQTTIVPQTPILAVAATMPEDAFDELGSSGGVYGALNQRGAAWATQWHQARSWTPTEDPGPKDQNTATRDDEAKPDDGASDKPDITPRDGSAEPLGPRNQTTPRLYELPGPPIETRDDAASRDAPRHAQPPAQPTFMPKDIPAFPAAAALTILALAARRRA